MRIGKVGLFILCFSLVLSSCKKDDGGDDIIAVELRDRAEQEIADQIVLEDYLTSHYYNSEELSNLANASITDIVITALAEGETDPPDGHTILKVDTEIKDVEFADTAYKVHILRLRQGNGNESPTFADNVRLLYEGFLEDGTIFDSSSTPVLFDLTQLIPGWRKVIPEFNIAESFVEQGDGTVNYVNGGLGIMFVPSGLAYFSNATGGIPSYTPIMFKFEVLQMFENDHDGDGIPSYLEDLKDENGQTDGEFIVNFQDRTDEFDDDTDGDTTPNYFDPDDDNDGIPTINEDLDGDGNYDEHDTNGNGIPNYLDTEDQEIGE